MGSGTSGGSGVGTGPGSIPGIRWAFISSLRAMTLVRGTGLAALRLHCAFPEFRNKNPCQELRSACRNKAVLLEQIAPGRNLANAEIREQAKRLVQRCNERACKCGAKAAFLRRLKFGNQPSGVWRDMGANPEYQVGRFCRAEAIKKEMRHDQVVVAKTRREASGIRAKCSHTRLRALPRCSRLEQAQHGRAGIDGVDLHGLIAVEQARCETAVAVADDQRLPRKCQRRQMDEAASLEHRAEGEILHWPIYARDTIEACRAYSFHGTSRSSGVSSDASARMRSASGESPASAFLDARL